MWIVISQYIYSLFFENFAKIEWLFRFGWFFCKSISHAKCTKAFSCFLVLIYLTSKEPFSASSQKWIFHLYYCLLKTQDGLYENVKIQNLIKFWLLKKLILPSLNEQNIVILRMFEDSKVQFIGNWTPLFRFKSAVSAFKYIKILGGQKCIFQLFFTLHSFE